MNRLPTLDETEAGQTSDTAYATGDTDALDAMDAADTRQADAIADEFAGHFRYCYIREGDLCSCGGPR